MSEIKTRVAAAAGESCEALAADCCLIKPFCCPLIIIRLLARGLSQLGEAREEFLSALGGVEEFLRELA